MKKPPPNEGDGDYSLRGALFGGTVGYNFTRDRLLFGLEGDIDWSGIDGASVTCGGTHECGASLGWVGTVRGRVGAFLHDATLLYVTGGLAIGEITAYDVTSPGFTGTKTRVGWTVGAGAEHRLSDAWSVKLEYLYMDFGRTDYFTITGHTPETVSFDVHTVRFGLNYRFGERELTRTPLK